MSCVERWTGLDDVYYSRVETRGRAGFDADSTVHGPATGKPEGTPPGWRTSSARGPLRLALGWQSASRRTAITALWPNGSENVVLGPRSEEVPLSTHGGLGHRTISRAVEPCGGENMRSGGKKMGRWYTGQYTAHGSRACPSVGASGTRAWIETTESSREGATLEDHSSAFSFPL